MPLTAKGQKIMREMKKEYGKGAERVFYASRNAGRIKNVDLKRKTTKHETK